MPYILIMMKIILLKPHGPGELLPTMDSLIAEVNQILMQASANMHVYAAALSLTLIYQ